MTWLIWRQHRLHALAAVLVLGIIGGLLALKSASESGGYHDQVLPCLSLHGSAFVQRSCGTTLQDFASDYTFGGTAGVLAALEFLPVFLGVFVGAPLVAREVERGTHRFAWTQSVTPGRWIAVNLTWLLAAAAVLAAAVMSFWTWWWGPVDRISGHLTGAAYDFEGPVMLGYTLFAVALGVAIGALVKRTLPAMALTLVVFLAVRLPFEDAVRPNLVRPVRVVWDALAPSSQVPADAWRLDAGWQDRFGHPLSASQEGSLFNQAQAAGLTFPQYLHNLGVERYQLYQPADRFWTFQGIETAVFVVLAAVAVAAAVLVVKGRLA